jgi:hypothetical protein
VPTFRGNILSRLGVTYKTGFGSDDWIYCTLYIHTVRDYRQLQRYRHYTHFPVHRCTRTRILSSLVVSGQRIFQSHCNFRSHMKSSVHRLFPFLPFILNHLGLPSPELDPVLFRQLLYTPSTLLRLLLRSAEHFL